MSSVIRTMNRREMISSLATGCAALRPLSTNAAQAGSYSVSTFSADVTPPLGHPLLAGWRTPAKTIRERLSARGFILWSDQKPLALCAVDWCELRNDAYDRWREAIADAIGTDRERVLVHCLHQHDAPYADLEAQRLLTEHGLPNAMFDPEFYEQVVQRVAQSAAASAKERQSVTHVGTGQAEVRDVACNRPRRK